MLVGYEMIIANSVLRASLAIYLTNSFHVAVRLFSNRSQMTSKCGKNKKVAHKAQPTEWVTDVLTTFWRPLWSIRELKQPRRRRQQKPHKFAYLTMENRIFARFARAFFIFWHFEDVLVLSTTWNGQFCCCVDDVSIWWEMFNLICLLMSQALVPI